jgi:histidyl-tRNA synthetase
MSQSTKSATPAVAPEGFAAGKAGKPVALQAVRGMRDILPDEAALCEHFEKTARDVFAQYGYRYVRLPIVEPTALFVRGIGEHTDVVEKEMYTFDDHGDSLTLRPEATAGIVRAAIEHNLTYERPLRIWTDGAMFRRERPQKGRYRQFHQLDVEALGFEGPDVDAEQIVMLARLWRALELTDVRLVINSIGDPRERLEHRNALVEYLHRHEKDLDDDSRRRLTTNPLRILDSKNPAMQEMIGGAPRLVDRLGSESLAHFEGVRSLLTDAGIEYTVEPRLVRGLDYYNRTVFEWMTDRLGTQGSVAGGGRYDGLFSQLGGEPTFACGFAIGIDRMVMLLQELGQQARAIENAAPLAYVVHMGDAAAPVARKVAESLRDRGHAIVVNAGGGSMKSQMKKADASGARYALIVGDDEVRSATVALKPLRGGEQIALPLADVASRLAALAGGQQG